MNSLIFTREKIYTKIVFASVFLLAAQSAHAAWTIDFSRREHTNTQVTAPVVETEQELPPITANDVAQQTIDSTAPVQNVVILNTENGFVPNTVRLREGSRYQINVVNINAKDKNVSFMLDAFSQHHGTYYGELKSFQITPDREGIYSFECPETSMQGKIVVYPAQNIRTPAGKAP